MRMKKPASYGGFFPCRNKRPQLFGAGSSWGQFRERRSCSYGAPFDAKTSTLRLLALVNLDRNQK
jgi:hypothetical protein